MLWQSPVAPSEDRYPLTEKGELVRDIFRVHSQASVNERRIFGAEIGNSHLTRHPKSESISLDELDH
jgi:hypothetical protein